MDTNTALVVIIGVLVLLAVLRGPKRPRYIPKKSRELAKAKFVQEFYSDPKNKGKRLPWKKLEYDHYVPFSDGGTHEPENIRLIPRKENRSKGAENPQSQDRMRTIVIVAIVLFILYLLSKP